MNPKILAKIKQVFVDALDITYSSFALSLF